MRVFYLLLSKESLYTENPKPKTKRKEPQKKKKLSFWRFRINGRTSKSISSDSSSSTHTKKLMHPWELSMGLCCFLEDLAQKLSSSKVSLWSKSTICIYNKYKTLISHFGKIRLSCCSFSLMFFLVFYASLNSWGMIYAVSLYIIFFKKQKYLFRW